MRNHVYGDTAAISITLRLIVGCLFLLGCATTRGEPQSVVAPTVVGENLVADPGFENRAASRWQEDNWALNEADFTRDETNPHSGRFCQRVVLKKILHEPALQLQCPIAARAGMVVRVSSWMRGLSNTRPVSMQVRKISAPYALYGEVEVSLTEVWQETVFQIVLPSGADPADTCLMFTLKGENQLWLDDVSVVELPPQAGGAPLVGNQIKNGSFEVGTDRWSATFWQGGGFPNFDAATEQNSDVGWSAPEIADAPHGCRALHFHVYPQGCGADITSAYFPLRYGHPATVSFWLKASEANRNFRVNLGGGISPNTTIQGQDYSTRDANWNFYSFHVTPKPSSSGTYFFELTTGGSGDYLLDAVAVQEGSEPVKQPNPNPVNVGWEPVDAAHPGNLFDKDEQVAFQILAEALPGTKPLALEGRVLDVWGHVVKNFITTMKLSDDGHGMAMVDLPADRFGGFKCEMRRGGSSDPIPDVEILYSVLPRLKPLHEVSDSFFGGHAMLTPYNLHIAERAGFRWLRLHPPLCTKWRSVEAQPGQFKFFTTGVERAKKMGFHILGSLDTTPPFYADAGSKPEADNPYKSYPPRDWEAWQRYVTNTIAAFAPFIDHWEIWNEPGDDFLRVADGVDKAQAYVNILQHTRAAVEKNHLAVTLVGLAVSGLDRPFVWQVLKLGGGREVDALSFHLYMEDLGVEEKTPSLRDQLARLSQATNRCGETPALWDTEGGIWLSSANTWLQTSRQPVTTLTTVLDAAHSLVRTAVGLKALGVAKHFHYQDMAAPSGRIVQRNECSGLVDVNGIPHAALAAHAAMVFFLEDAAPVGLDEITVGQAKVAVARFTRQNRNIAVAWSRVPVTVGEVFGDKLTFRQAFDMMGNPIPLNTHTPITLSPIYLLGTDKSIRTTTKLK